MQPPHLSFNRPNQPPCFIVSNGVIATTAVPFVRRRTQILPTAQETTARKVRTEMTAKNGPRDPDDEDEVVLLPAWLLVVSPWSGNDEIEDAIVIGKLSKRNEAINKNIPRFDAGKRKARVGHKKRKMGSQHGKGVCLHQKGMLSFLKLYHHTLPLISSFLLFINFYFLLNKKFIYN